MNTGALRHTVTLDTPKGDTSTYTPLDPAEWRCGFLSDTAAAAIFMGRYHPGITTATRVHFEGRTFHVDVINDREARHVELVLTCREVFD